jgi:hypothetical protein
LSEKLYANQEKHASGFAKKTAMARGCARGQEDAIQFESSTRLVSPHSPVSSQVQYSFQLLGATELGGPSGSIGRL